MTVKVTIEYPSIDAAIVGLGKLVGAPVSAKGGTDKAVPSEPVAPTTRKPRADKGQGRGKYKPRQEPTPPAPAVPPADTPPAAPKQEQPASPETAAPEPARAPSVEQTPAPAAVVPSDDDMTKALEGALERLSPKIGNDMAIQKCMALLEDFGAKRWREVKPEQRAEFITKCDKLGAE